MKIKQSIPVVLICFISIFFAFADIKAQDKTLMQNYIFELNKLFESAFSAQTDNERFNNNEQAALLLEEALAQPKSFFFDWKELQRVSVLKAEDNKFQIFTWAIIRDDGEFDCFGYMQVFNSKTEEYEIFPLTDRSNEITNPEEATLSEKNWLGAIYSDLITTKYNDKTYYTLLGWSGVGPIKQRKIIEIISFKGSSPRPIFGQSLFFQDKNRRRVIFEYSKETRMMLTYDEQYYITKKKSRDKNGKTFYEEIKNKEKMIIFDLLEPTHPGMEGISQYYFPAGNENGYRFENGKWKLEKEVQTLLPKSKKIDVESMYKYKAPQRTILYSN